MPIWDDIKSGVRSLTNTVIRETDELAEEASLAIKKKTVEAHLAEAYENLGKVSYRLLSEEDAAIRQNQELSDAVKEVDRLRAELNEVQARIRRFRENES